MPANDPAVRAHSARNAALTRWAFEPDPTAATAKARSAFMASFENAVDPDGTLAPAERAKRAERLRKAHFAKMAIKSAQSRRKASTSDEAA